MRKRRKLLPLDEPIAATLAAVESNHIFEGPWASEWQQQLRDQIGSIRSPAPPGPLNTLGSRRRLTGTFLKLLVTEDLPTKQTLSSHFDEAFHYARTDSSPWELMRKVYKAVRETDKVLGGIGRKETDKRARQALALTATGRYWMGPPKRKRRTTKR
jgi:hypothetical protein